MIYTKQQLVGSGLIGSDAKLSTMGIFHVVEEGITECMAELHIDGSTVRREYNAFWVFTKNRVAIFGAAAWCETVTVESFISNISLVKLDIDTAIKNMQGELIAYSRCEMCALDVTTGRIRRTSSVGIDQNFVAEQSQTEVVFDKLDDSNLPVVDSVTVRYTNIDFSQHCNNVEYLRFLLNTYTVTDIFSRPIKEIQVDYVTQSYEGDMLTVHKLSTDACDLLAIEKDGQTVVKCQIIR